MQQQIDNLLLKKIAKECDMFFVIGSKNSSNSIRLVEVARKIWMLKFKINSFR